MSTSLENHSTVHVIVDVFKPQRISTFPGEKVVNEMFVILQWNQNKNLALMDH